MIMSSLFLCCFLYYVFHHHLHSFPTRRSSDLHRFLHRPLVGSKVVRLDDVVVIRGADRPAANGVEDAIQDRKSTRLNSSHRCISYAVFCLKKKKKKRLNKTRYKVILLTSRLRS